jgi:hypothetical protein
MSNPFDYVTSINSTKKNLMRNSENDTLSEKDYSPYVVNKALSYFPDTILHANMVNQHHQLDKRPQYEFLLNSIRPQKRFAKWVKDAGDKELDVICEYYKCNRNLGRQYLSLLSSEEIKIMEQQLEIGGNKK